MYRHYTVYYVKRKINNKKGELIDGTIKNFWRSIY